MKEADDYLAKAKKCMQKGIFSSPDPVAASTFYKRAADAYQQCAERRLERLYRVQSAGTQMQVGAWATAASEYTRAAELAVEAEDLSQEDGRREAAALHTQASQAWLHMNEKSKAAGSKVQAAVALNYGDESKLLSKQALAGMEEAVEAHVPDILNPYGRYRQTGVSAFVDADSDETVTNPSPENLALAKEHIVTRAYAHEPLQDLCYLLVDYGEYASALYAAGAATVILEQDGISTLSLGRAYVTETILTLAMGDPVAAEEQFLKRHVQKTTYLSSRECKMAEDLFRAIKTRDLEGLEEARAPGGSNRGGLANLHASIRTLVGYLRLSGVARKTLGETVAPKKSKPKGKPRRSGSGDSGDSSGGPKKKGPPRKKKPSSGSSTPEPEPPTLQELSEMKTGYEQDEVEAGENLDGDALADELDGMDFDDLDSDDLEDDDIDLR